MYACKTTEEFDRAYGDWHVAYHGTSKHCAMTILQNGLQPTKDSKGAMSSSTCYLKPEEEALYLSPSIEYAGHPRYATIWKINGRYVQMVLQVGSACPLSCIEHAIRCA